MINECKDLDFFFGRVAFVPVFYKGIGFLNLSASATPHFQVLEFAWSVGLALSQGIRFAIMFAFQCVNIRVS